MNVCYVDQFLTGEKINEIIYLSDVTNESDRGRGTVCDGECDHS